jgi:predicted DNA-binding transcriptional regulator YafY
MSTGAPEVAARVVRILYTNYRNETSVRTILPQRIWFGATPWHKEPQWLLDALDVEKGEQRSFALADVRSWQAVEEAPTKQEG